MSSHLALAAETGPPPAENATSARPPLRRPRESLVSGTSVAVAAHLGWPVAGVRAIFVALTLLWGAGALLYAWLWVFTPLEDPRGGEPASTTHRAPIAWILTTVAVLGMACTLVILMNYGPGAVVDVAASVWFFAIMATTAVAAAAGLWSTLVDRADPNRGPKHELGVRATVTAVLVVLFVVVLTTLQFGGIAAFLAALIPLAGLLVVYSSSLIAKFRELSGERIRRIREEQRSEIAAHLHDSVLQTLALIQNRAGASSEVARLARAQERELRAWLYDGDSPADSDLQTDLRDYAGALELDYPVRIDVVTAGSSLERASGEVAAAAREAMLNAARHAGGDVSVYIEGAGASVDVFIRDRGPGFDPAVVASDRLGVRESIVGRMRRAGGQATVRPGAGGVGVEVHLEYRPESRAGDRSEPGEARRG